MDSAASKDARWAVQIFGSGDHPVFDPARGLRIAIAPDPRSDAQRGCAVGPRDVERWFGLFEQAFPIYKWNPACSFAPAASPSALKSVRAMIRDLNIVQWTHLSLADIAKKLNPLLRGGSGTMADTRAHSWNPCSATST
jgi:hypothetical protein